MHKIAQYRYRNIVTSKYHAIATPRCRNIGIAQYRDAAETNARQGQGWDWPQSIPKTRFFLNRLAR